MPDCKYGTSRRRSGVFLEAALDKGIKVPPPSSDEELEVDDSRVQAEGLSPGEVQPEEAKVESSRKVQVRHPVGLVGTAESRITLKIIAGRREVNVCVAEAQTTSLLPVHS